MNAFESALSPVQNTSMHTTPLIDFSYTIWLNFVCCVLCVREWENHVKFVDMMLTCIFVCGSVETKWSERIYYIVRSMENKHGKCVKLMDITDYDLISIIESNKINHTHSSSSKLLLYAYRFFSCRRKGREKLIWNEKTTTRTPNEHFTYLLKDNIFWFE